MKLLFIILYPLILSLFLLSCEIRKEERQGTITIPQNKVIKVMVSCAAVLGEASSSCCREIKPIYLNIFVENDFITITEQGNYKLITKMEIIE